MEGQIEKLGSHQDLDADQGANIEVSWRLGKDKLGGCEEFATIPTPSIIIYQVIIRIKTYLLSQGEVLSGGAPWWSVLSTFHVGSTSSIP